jgi:molybdopterin-containing oxidoreductase family iron-sulfur binding subunit
MVIDLEKCTGCQACTTACHMENGRLPNENWQDVLFYNEGEFPSGKLTWLPRPCMHCEHPSCVAVCPTGASYKTEDGVVLIDWDRCIGCKYCMIACPYGVRFYAEEKQKTQPDIREVFPDEEGDRVWSPPWQLPTYRQDNKIGVGIQPKNVVSKCTFCYHRISRVPEGTVDIDPSVPELRDLTPACVVTCAPTARYFGDLDNPESEVRRLIAEKRGTRLLDQTGNRPQVYYLAGEQSSIPETRSVRRQSEGEV